MSFKEYDTLVFVGRFQPFHNGHKKVVDEALKRANKVVVMIGSSFQARDIRNPFTFNERKLMIDAVYPDEARLHVRPVRDYPYDDGKWINAIQRQVESVASKGEKVGLIGHSKDHTSYYLKIFPTWGNVEVSNYDGINATDIRENLLTNNFVEDEDLLPEAVVRVLDQHVCDWDGKFPFNDFGRMQTEFQIVSDYRKAWEAAPYPPTFMTVDAVVVQSGHVLLVKRGASPGKGLWALPGGFLDQSETMLDGCIRELREETKIKVPPPVLRGSVKDQKTFDAPNRSTRGRTITQAYYIELAPDTDLPKVKGADDAVKARWVPFAEVNPEELFEDHAHIIDYFTNIG